MAAYRLLPAAWKWLGRFGWVCVAAQSCSILDRKPCGEDVALHHRAATQMHQANRPDLALDIAKDDDILSQNGGLHAAFGANGQAGALESNHTLNLSVDQQVFRAGDLSANLRQGSNYSGTFTWLHTIWPLLGNGCGGNTHMRTSPTIPN
jgi:hypothetical protein